MKISIGFFRFIKTNFKFIVFGLVISICVFAVVNDISYTVCLQLQDNFVKFKTEREISSLKKEMDEIYRQIGQKIYFNENVDYLINELENHKEAIINRQKEVSVFHNKLKERIIFEKMLKRISSARGEIKCQAIRNLVELDTNKSLPYISMCLFDPDMLVRKEAAVTINAVIDVTSDEAKMRIPNLKYVKGILQDIGVSSYTDSSDVFEAEQFPVNGEVQEK